MAQEEQEKESQEQEAQDQEQQAEDSQEEESEESKKNETAVDNRPPSIVYGPAAPRPLTLTFGELLDHHAEVRPDKPAIISHVQGYTISWSQLRNRSLQLARAFAQDGIKKGDLVAISMGSRVEYFEVCSSLCDRAASDLTRLRPDFLRLRVPRRRSRDSELRVRTSRVRGVVENHR